MNDSDRLALVAIAATFNVPIGAAWTLVDALLDADPGLANDPRRASVAVRDAAFDATHPQLT